MSGSVFIIAEAGVNHNGSMELAYRLIDEAVNAKVDAIKFQTFKSEKDTSKYVKKAEYQEDNSGETQLEMVKKLELSYEQFRLLKEYCDKKGILFLSSPFEEDSILFLNELGLEIFKIPSSELTNIPYLDCVGKLKKKVILSTGMAFLGEVEKAIEILREQGTEDIVILHCNTEYPTPMCDVNLKAMQTMKDAFGCEVGYSDHTVGIEVPIAAVAMGAKVIEKHFTLDKTMKGPDHKASLEPMELAEMVEKIRNIEMAIGDGIKRPSESERKNITVTRKSIVASKTIYKGELLGVDNITTKRAGSGLSAEYWELVIGRKAVRDFEADEPIEI